MLAGEEYRADSNPRSEIVRECPGDPGLRRGVVSGTQSWGEALRALGQAKQLFRRDHAHSGNGLHWRRTSQCGKRHGQWTQSSLRLGSILLLFAAAGAVSCGDRRGPPQAMFDHAYTAFQHGESKQSQDEAAQGYLQFRSSNPEWA